MKRRAESETPGEASDRLSGGGGGGIFFRRRIIGDVSFCFLSKLVEAYSRQEKTSLQMTF